METKEKREPPREKLKSDAAQRAKRGEGERDSKLQQFRESLKIGGE